MEEVVQQVVNSMRSGSYAALVPKPAEAERALFVSDFEIVTELVTTMDGGNENG